MSSKVESRRRQLQILLAEDEFLLAATIEHDLRCQGHEVIGPFSGLREATEASRDQIFDMAVLDVNLNGEMVFPLADELLAGQVPFILLTGYSGSHLPEGLRNVPRLSKPYDLSALIALIEVLKPSTPDDHSIQSPRMSDSRRN